MTFGYNLGIRAYGWGIRLASPFVAKAKLWVEGRRNWKPQLKAALKGKKGWIWMHCASLGEFEQGRNLLEQIRAQYPQKPILLTFFSPSGYEIRKDYTGADHVCYLPLDTPQNARDFLAVVQPSLAFFVKYDLWLNHLGEMRKLGIPHFLVSALLRADSRFLKSRLKTQYRDAFRGFQKVFAQDADTVSLLREFAGDIPMTITGDTRFDRAAQLPGQFTPLPEIEAFVQGRPCIVAGSPHGPDEKLLLPAIESLRNLGFCWIVAPHEIDKAGILAKVKASGGRMVAHSQWQPGSEKAPEVLWIDNVGMLSRLYHYAELAYIGGGFGGGIHNTQEPAVYGIPVLFGPKYHGFQEAVDMVKSGSAFVVTTQGELESRLRQLMSDETLRKSLGRQNAAYMEAQAGATAKIMDAIQHLL